MMSPLCYGADFLHFHSTEPHCIIGETHINTSKFMAIVEVLFSVLQNFEPTVYIFLFYWEHFKFCN